MQYRQGDVFIEGIKKPTTVKGKRILNGVLVEGEVTGHAHRVQKSDLDAVEIVAEAEHIVLSARRDITIVHEEHSPITLPAGDYKVGIQREYSPQEIRLVRD